MPDCAYKILLRDTVFEFERTSEKVFSESEQGMGRWVMGHGSNGSRKWDGSHGSWVAR